MKSLTQNVDLIPEAKEATPQGLFTKEVKSSSDDIALSNETNS